MTRTANRSAQILTRLSTLLLVVSIGFGVLLLIGAAAGFGPNGDDVAVHTQVEAERLADLPRGAITPDDIPVTVRVRDASNEQLRWAAARDLAPGAVVVAAVWLLRGLLRTVRDGDPFTETNVRRLRALAMVLLIGVPLAAFFGSLFAGELAASVGLASPGTRLTMPGNVVLGALAIFALAEVFAGGVRLRQDMEGTI